MLSHHRKFIFVHIPKTGGTSVETSLRPYSSPSNGVEGSWPFKSRTWRNKFLFDALRDYPDYFSFAIVRNPWDRIVSNWKFFAPDIPFREFVDQTAEFLNTSPSGYYREIPNNFCTKGIAVPLSSLNHHFENTNLGYHLLPQVYFLECELSFVGRFESLHEHWKFITTTLGLSAELPHKYKTAHGHYSEYFDPETRVMIGSLYKDDIERFQYTFEGPSEVLS